MPRAIYISHFDVGLRIMSGGLMLEKAYCEADDGDVLKIPPPKATDSTWAANVTVGILSPRFTRSMALAASFPTEDGAK